MSDATLYNTTAPTSGSLQLAHQKILRVKQGGVFVNITGDINNLAGNPAPIEVMRENYGQKTRSGTQIIGYNFAPTFDVEAVRGPITKAITQTWLVDLLAAAYAEGADNERDFQWFDALDENLPSFEGTFSISVMDMNTGYADKGGYKFTLKNQGVVNLITSPIAGTAEPIIESVSPSGETVGDQIVLRGYKFTGTTGITVDTEAVLVYYVVDDNTIVLTIPAAVAGAAPIIVTNATGASAAFAYVAA